MTEVMNTNTTIVNNNNNNNNSYYNLDILAVPGYVVALFIFIILCIVRWQRLERCQIISGQLYGKNTSNNGEIELNDKKPIVKTITNLADNNTTNINTDNNV